MGLMCYISPKDSWKVSLNDKLVLSSTKEDEASNTKKISSTVLKKNGELYVKFSPALQAKGWRRSILIFDEDDNEVIRQDGGNILRVDNKKLLNLFSEKKQIRIFTTLTPTDPNIAARTRIRRVHLCTLELTN